MAWETPTLRQCREMVRDDVTAALSGSVLVANSVLRVISDAVAAMAHLVLRYIDWLALQLMPDTAATEWLDRHADIWLVNADESIGRKAATVSYGTVTLTGTAGTVVPRSTRFFATVGGSDAFYFETTEQVTIGAEPTVCRVTAVSGGSVGNFAAGETFQLETAISGVDSDATVVELAGGTDQETDDEVRMRVLERIREPPMGGDAEDYVAWALQVPGVTRAWCAPMEMGMGTVTVRFMMDDLRATDDPTTNGFPLAADVETVKAYLNRKRPVAVKDFFVAAPLPEPINMTIYNLSDYSASTMQEITDSIEKMLLERAKPAYAVDGVMYDAQTIYNAWVSEAILDALDVDGYFNLEFPDHPMPGAGYLAVLGTVTFA